MIIAAPRKPSPEVERPADEELYLLPVSLLESHAARVEEFVNLSRRLRIPLGWHYLLDLVWAADKLEHLSSGSTVLDAGAGTGLMQWWLANRGMTVISVDRVARHFPRRLREWCEVKSFCTADLPSLREAAIARLRSNPGKLARSPRALASTVQDLVLGNPKVLGTGTILALQANLRDISIIPDASVDAVVSISSLEHNEPADLRSVVTELFRTMKPGGPMVATLGAAAETDWYHQPSSGWCYSEATLREMFALDPRTASNFDQFNAEFEALKASVYLRERLSAFYFQAGNNGMPYGVWDPQYMSAGVFKIRS